MSKITINVMYFPQSHSERSSSSWSHCFSTFTKRDKKQLGYALYCIDIFLWLHIGLKWHTIFPIILEVSTCSFCSLVMLSTEGLSAIILVCWLWGSCIGDREFLWMSAASKTLLMMVSEFSEIISEHCLFIGVKLEYWSSAWILLEDSSGGFSNSKKKGHFKI